MKKMALKKIILVFALFFGANGANLASAAQDSQDSPRLDSQRLEAQKLEAQKLEAQKLEALDAQIKGNPWMLKYKNYSEYNAAHAKTSEIEARLEAAKIEPKTRENLAQIAILEQQHAAFKHQEELLSGYKNEPYKELTTAQNELPKITNPFLIAGAFSYIKNLRAQVSEIQGSLKSLDSLIAALSQKVALLGESSGESKSESKSQSAPAAQNAKNAQNLAETLAALNELESISKILRVYTEIFAKNAENDIEKIQQDIKREGLKLLYILLFIAALTLFSFIIKLILKASSQSTIKSYTINKFLSFLNITLVFFILVFTYIENVTYIVAIVGFVSAGLAIAMKDWFMSLLGYLVIVGGGTIKSGDRIRVVKDNAIYVGDVIDISALRITLYEDVTYTTYVENRRAGRFVFIPNNYIFTTMIANYSHANMKTVWDGIDITITFKSNYKKALYLASQIAKKYALGYTETTKRQLNSLKSTYSLRDMSVEPRVFSFVVPNGIKISVWYQTNAYATLMLNSVISGEIIEAFTSEADIEISYPTTSVVMKDSGTVSPLAPGATAAGGVSPGESAGVDSPALRKPE